MDDKKTILFNASKKETHHPNSGYKKLFRRLRSNYKVSTNKEEISGDRLGDVSLAVFGGPREPFSVAEFNDLKAWLNAGGRALVMLGDGGEKQSGCNMNYLLEEYGMSINNDSVVRSVFYKYLHPKEVFIAEGTLVPDIIRKKNVVASSGNKKNASKAGTVATASKADDAKSDKLVFVYPYGASLNVQRPAIPLLSSGSISYPMNRPIAAMWEAETVAAGAGGQRGRLVLMGSVEIFGDDWIDKEENSKLCDLLFAWLLSEVDLDMTSDRQDADLSDYSPVPNVDTLSHNLKPCLQGMDDLPRDFTKLFDMNMFRFDTDLIPATIRVYEQLGVPHEPLTLIPPQFECPLPKLNAATFPPAMREPAPPALDQFDLDEHFAKEGLRLAQLTNKCTSGEEDLEYYIAESGEILGVMQDLPYGERSAKHILFHIFKQIVDFKKQDAGKYAYGGPNGSLVPYGGGEGAEQEGDGAGGMLMITGGGGGGEGGVAATAYPYHGDFQQGNTVEAAAPVHLAHVDLAPMKHGGSTKLQQLDPTLQLGGPAIGSINAETK
mmetsp:Transcript_10229/g.16783  ORF Transcript_10229/g.16783 Transcript_10229/m.16783 type:complete len:550 (-) Transcript_10229:120-1769(-)|eukprot:CAMPEP_0175004076 /NCGR_PEP_ID=MMETSP0005-20121125/4566_1 /TAXON_ID=420556 /ORGANISM="Ochromonas sp., Strain CCMP1393" /LENGTH=549 /DNA_ID=CAMNT_0016259189 /DNA_START=162 /DNA_END=1811 /DNA_ORIENTATION=+